MSARAELLKLHDWDELLFGGFYCLHCTPDDEDSFDDPIAWPCRPLRDAGLTDDEAREIIAAHREKVEAEYRAKKAAEQAEAQRHVNTFNHRYPVGTLVFAYPGCRPEDGTGPRLVTRTRTTAQLSSSGNPVVWVEGEGSYISLTHVDPVSEDVWAAAREAEKPVEPEAAPESAARLSPEREAEIAAAVAVYEGHPDIGFACCSAHAPADGTRELLAELAAVRAERDAWRDQRNAVFATNERLLVQVDELGQARLHAENEARAAKREARDELTALRALELGDPDNRVSATCADPGHPTWLRAQDDTRGCPWCRVAELEAANAEAVGVSESLYRRLSDGMLAGSALYAALTMPTTPEQRQAALDQFKAVARREEPAR